MSRWRPPQSQREAPPPQLAPGHYQPLNAHCRWISGWATDSRPLQGLHSAGSQCRFTVHVQPCDASSHPPSHSPPSLSSRSAIQLPTVKTSSPPPHLIPAPQPRYSSLSSCLASRVDTSGFLVLSVTSPGAPANPFSRLQTWWPVLPTWLLPTMRWAQNEGALWDLQRQSQSI
jgi:hypothetical protein